MAYVTGADILKGRVLMLNPVDLKGGAEIGAFQGVNPLGGNSPHYFMCIGSDTTHSYWCPLSSQQKPPGIGTQDMQGYIKPASKLGFPHFRNATSWFDSGQVWKISNLTVINAANKEQSNRREGGVFNCVATTLIDKFFPGA